jgi:hypothetical protein
VCIQRFDPILSEVIAILPLQPITDIINADAGMPTSCYIKIPDSISKRIARQSLGLLKFSPEISSSHI